MDCTRGIDAKSGSSKYKFGFSVTSQTALCREASTDPETSFRNKFVMSVDHVPLKKAREHLSVDLDEVREAKDEINENRHGGPPYAQ